MTAALQRAGAAPARAAHGLVLVHGRGGSAEDILSLLAHAGLPGVAAVAPAAPGGSWWPTSFLAPSAALAPHLVAGLAAVAAAVADLRAGGLEPGRIWVAGFSQGACLGLEYLARQGAGLAGGFGFSGGLVGTGDAPGEPQADLYGHAPKAFDYSGRLDGADIYLGCHQRDPHIPARRVLESATALRALGAAVETRMYPGAGHAVMREDIAALRARLNG